MNLILPGGIYMKKFVFSRHSRVSLVRRVRESVVSVVVALFVKTDPRQKLSGMTPKADLSSFPNVAGVRYLPLFQAVIPESRSRESVVNVVAVFSVILSKTTHLH